MGRRCRQAGLDGIIAKPIDGTYEPGVRALIKVKPVHTADVVVAGWRPYKTPGADGGPLVGSLLLAAYDDAGRLHHVGAASSFLPSRTAEMTDLLRPLVADDAHPWHEPDPAMRVPDAPNRWRRAPTRTCTCSRKASSQRSGSTP